MSKTASRLFLIALLLPLAAGLAGIAFWVYPAYSKESECRRILEGATRLEIRASGMRFSSGSFCSCAPVVPQLLYESAAAAEIRELASCLEFGWHSYEEPCKCCGPLTVEFFGSEQTPLLSFNMHGSKDLRVSGKKWGVLFLSSVGADKMGAWMEAKGIPPRLRKAMDEYKAGREEISQSLKPERPEAIGYWRVHARHRLRESPGLTASPSVVRFSYDGTSVTLHLLSEKQWMWRSQDNHYRLKCRWVEDKLQYLPPFGDWVSLAAFNCGRFVSTDGNPPWEYERVTERDMSEEDRVLLKPREIHDYRVRPDGSLDRPPAFEK